MITKSRLLLAVASEIADVTGCRNNIALLAAEHAFKSVSLHVISPLLDAMDYDARPAYREIVMNQVRDLMADEPEVPSMEDPKAAMEVRDEQ